MTVYLAIQDDQTIQGGAGADVITIAPFLGVDNAVLNGGGGNDLIDGAYGHNTTLNGEAGADLLKGHDGDHFIGGSGFDTAFVDLTATDSGITGDLTGLGAGATVTISQASLATVEIAVLALGDGADHVTTSADAQIGVFAGGGDDVLLGRGGVDILAGGAGSDRIEGGGGADVLYGYSPQQILGFNVSPGADDGLGRDSLSGGAGADLLVGSLGDDLLDGGSGLDFVSYDNAPGGVSVDLSHARQHTGSAGDDVLRHVENVIGSANDDHITGSDGANALTGGKGADTIEGGGGVDILSGGAGADVFVYAKAADSDALGPDLITDLGQGDTVDLSGIDANTGKGGNQAFHTVGHFTGHAGELMLVYDSTSKTTTVLGDTNGDALPDLGIVVTGDQTGFTGWVL